MRGSGSSSGPERAAAATAASTTSDPARIGPTIEIQIKIVSNKRQTRRHRQRHDDHSLVAQSQTITLLVNVQSNISTTATTTTTCDHIGCQVEETLEQHELVAE